MYNITQLIDNPYIVCSAIFAKYNATIFFVLTGWNVKKAKTNLKLNQILNFLWSFHNHFLANLPPAPQLVVVFTLAMSYCKNNLLFSHPFVYKEKENYIRVTKFVLYLKIHLLGCQQREWSWQRRGRR